MTIEKPLAGILIALVVIRQFRKRVSVGSKVVKAKTRFKS